MVMVSGRVIRFDESKGYGFIAPSDGGEDIFLHANELIDRGLRVTVGTQVEFRVVEGERGLKAYDVHILDDGRPTAGSSAGPASGGSSAAAHQPEKRAPSDDELVEIFSEQEFVQQITDLLLATVPQLTGAVILELRGSLLEFARKNGWVD